MDLDLGMIKKFGRLNIAAPVRKGDIEKVELELSELK